MSKAREIAEERLAKGEISEDEFQNIIKNLSSTKEDNNEPVLTQTAYSHENASPTVDNTFSNHENFNELEYVGFWSRLGAMLIDVILLLLITAPILTMLYGTSYWTSDKIIHGGFDFYISWVLPIVGTIIFWEKKQATPGKMAISAKIVDSKTGNVPSSGQLIARYFSYFLSAIPLGL